MWKSLLAGGAAFLIGAAAGAFVAGPPIGAGSLAPIEVSARSLPLDPAEPGRAMLGPLRFLGALHLTSREMRFGGISALLTDERCGKLLAVTDAGSWLILEPQEEGGRLTGIAAAWIAPVLDQQGRPPASKPEADAEALMRDGDDVLVWFEQDHRAQRYPGLSPCRPESLAVPAAEVIRMPEMAGWPDNGGVEAAALLGTRWILVSERAEPDAKSVVGLIREGDEVKRFRFPVQDEFWPTAADAIDGERLLVVGRRFSRLKGVAASIGIARLPEGEGGTAHVVELARLAPPLAVDNMEAVAVRREGGRTFIYMASDDNFNRLQRTLLMKFELVEERPSGR